VRNGFDGARRVWQALVPLIPAQAGIQTGIA